MEPSLIKFVENNALLFAVAVISGAMLLWPLFRKSSGGPWIEASEATQLINREDALVVDVRESGEYGAGHVLGAKNIPLGRIDGSGELAKKKDRAIILYCDSGARSGKALAALKKLGYEKVFNLSGGLPAWRQAGLPVEKK